MEDIIRTAVSPVYFKNARKWAHSIHKSNEKQYSLGKLEVMTITHIKNAMSNLNDLLSLCQYFLWPVSALCPETRIIDYR